MRIAKNSVVTLRYTLSDALGKLIEDSRKPMVYLHGGYANILPKIEQAMEGRARGYRVKLRLAPVDAFGDHDPALVQTVARNALPASTKLGGQLRSGGGDGSQAVVYKVTRFEAGNAILDANHPLAGQVVEFDLTVLDLRLGSEVEIEHGHVHGAHGHQH